MRPPCSGSTISDDVGNPLISLSRNANMSLRRLAGGVVLLALACAAPRPEPAAPDHAIIVAQIDSLWTRYKAAAVAEDVDALARIYTDSAYLVELGLPTTRGNAAIHSLVKEVLAGVRILESDIRPELTEVLGDRVLQIGEYRDVLQPTGQPVQAAFGRFAAVLRQDSVGSWRVDRLIAFPDSTVAQAASGR
jgi:ketosteroid isomerase-like protein